MSTSSKIFVIYCGDESIQNRLALPWSLFILSFTDWHYMFTDLSVQRDIHLQQSTYINSNHRHKFSTWNIHRASSVEPRASCIREKGRKKLRIEIWFAYLSTPNTHIHTNISVGKWKVCKHCFHHLFGAVEIRFQKHVEYFIGESALKGFPDYKFFLCFRRPRIHFVSFPTSVFIIPHFIFSYLYVHMFMAVFSSGIYVWILLFLFHIQFRLFHLPFGLFAMQMKWFVSKVKMLLDRLRSAEWSSI